MIYYFLVIIIFHLLFIFKFIIFYKEPQIQKLKCSKLKISGVKNIIIKKVKNVYKIQKT